MQQISCCRDFVHLINGIHSPYGYGARSRAADPEFFPLVEKLRNIQQSGQIGLRVKRTGTETGPRSYLARSSPQR